MLSTAKSLVAAALPTPVAFEVAASWATETVKAAVSVPAAGVSARVQTLSTLAPVPAVRVPLVVPFGTVTSAAVKLSTVSPKVKVTVNAAAPCSLVGPVIARVGREELLVTAWSVTSARSLPRTSSSTVPESGLS